MTNWKEISAGQTFEKLETEEVVIIDIRDADSYDASHVPESIHLNKENSKDFIDSADKAIPVIVYCYHGNNSKSAASFLLSEGFEEVYSMAGGFESWSNSFPCEP
jgi:thiosulfate sulfurtransferase